MTALALDLTRAGLISAQTPAPEKTLGDVFEAKHAWRLDYLIDAPLSMRVSEAKAKFAKAIAREELKLRHRHWSAPDRNKLIALQFFASALED